MVLLQASEVRKPWLVKLSNTFLCTKPLKRQPCRLLLKRATRMALSLREASQTSTASTCLLSRCKMAWLPASLSIGKVQSTMQLSLRGRDSLTLSSNHVLRTAAHLLIYLSTDWCTTWGMLQSDSMAFRMGITGYLTVRSLAKRCLSLPSLALDSKDVASHKLRWMAMEVSTSKWSRVTCQTSLAMSLKADSSECWKGTTYLC